MGTIRSASQPAASRATERSAPAARGDSTAVEQALCVTTPTVFSASLQAVLLGAASHWGLHKSRLIAGSREGAEPWFQQPQRALKAHSPGLHVGDRVHHGQA